ncbi:MAG: aspartate--tRNA ligase [Bacteroidetes bacterium]|jgi:aspartyl-tRNA synthetase|nr:aspartate--tRNA ligase [Bacteroidota bacterium]
MYRTHTCGQLRIDHCNETVTLSGWIQRSRDLGGMTFMDLRDRYGITQLVFNMETNADLCKKARKLGREYVIQINGVVAERSNKNKNIPTGDIEILVDEIIVLNASEVPPFTIEDETDGGEELRMKYRYLDLRRNVMKNNLILRHRLARETRKYLDQNDFIEVETPVLIKSTPEGARDFVVPSRMNSGQFYALPQSPQTFKQLLMIGGYDRYFQLVKCFRDEDFRADRQPEFTQIDCEMAFVEKQDVMNMFEGLVKHLFNGVLGFDMEGEFPQITYTEAMEKYGNDKPDMRFGMLIHELTRMAQGKGFKVFDSVEYIGGIRVEGYANYTRKQLDELTAFVQKPQIGAKGLVYVKCNEDGSFKSSVDKFFGPDDLHQWAEALNAQKGDLLLILAGEKRQTLHALSELRLEMGNRLGLRDKDKFAPLWVKDFPLLEYDAETNRYYAMHHPFTSPVQEDLDYFESDPAKMRAEAYDMVINGVEIGGGSIRIHNRETQQKMLKALGFSDDEASEQFGFLMEAFKFGAPPHGGIAFGFDRIAAMFAGEESIREVIAFPKNNAGRDIMIDSPANISEVQLKELNLKLSQ